MPITADKFIENLTTSGLMSAEEISSVQDTLQDVPTDGEGLAKLFVREKKLTKYQAAAVFQGKIQHLLLGDYVVVDKLGQGGMGQVLKARQPRMDRMVAIKVLPPKRIDSPEAIARFQKEVRAAGKLAHSNIVTAFDAGEHEGIHYLVMEYVDGKDLSCMLKEDGPLPVEKAVKYFIRAAEGLKYAHEKGVIHRDIKPSNLLVSKEGTVKILDMGLARLNANDMGNSPSADDDEQLTSTGQVMGTADYMAPEQAMDTRKADQRSDIYALGCTLYRVLTGETPFKGETMMMKVMAHQRDEIPSLRSKRSDVPERLDALFQKMLAKEPEDRPQTMAAVIDGLQACMSRSPAAPPAPSSEPRRAEPVEQISRAKPAPAPTPPPAASTVHAVPVQTVATEANPQFSIAADTDRRHKRRKAHKQPAWVLPSVIGGALAVICLVAILIVALTRRDDRDDVDLAVDDSGQPGVSADDGSNASAGSTVSTELATTPTQIPFDGGVLTLRLPKIFTESADVFDASSSRDPLHSSLQLEPNRIQPEFVSLPGYLRMYERFLPLTSTMTTRKATLPGYLYVAVLPVSDKSEPDLMSEIKRQLINKFGNARQEPLMGVWDWETKSIPLPDGGSRDVRKITAIGDQDFHFHGDVGNVKYLKSGKYVLYLYSTNGHHVLIGGRKPMESVDTIRMEDLAEATVGTIRLEESTPGQNGRRTKKKNTRVPSPLSTAQVAEVEEALRQTKVLLASRDIAGGRRVLDRAEQIVQYGRNPDLGKKVRRMDILILQVESFWRAVGKGMKDLGGQDLKVGDSTVIQILEASANHIRIRQAGRNQDYTLQEMPPGLARAIAERWLNDQLDDQPYSKVLLGAFMAVEPRYGPDRAREQWQEVLSSGEPSMVELVKDIMPILDDL